MTGSDSIQIQLAQPDGAAGHVHNHVAGYLAGRDDPVDFAGILVS